MSSDCLLTEVGADERQCPRHHDGLSRRKPGCVFSRRRHFQVSQGKHGSRPANAARQPHARWEEATLRRAPRRGRRRWRRIRGRPKVRRRRREERRRVGAGMEKEPPRHRRHSFILFAFAPRPPPDGEALAAPLATTTRARSRVLPFARGPLLSSNCRRAFCHPSRMRLFFLFDERTRGASGSRYLYCVSFSFPSSPRTVRTSDGRASGSRRAGSQKASNEKAMNVQCKVCMATFMCTISEGKLKEHAENRHPKNDFYQCFPHLKA